MLPSATIHRIAEDLLEQARTRRFGFTDAAGVPVAPLYQCGDMKRLPQGLQHEIVRRATAETGATPLFVLAFTAWIAALAAVYVAEPTAGGIPLVPSAFLILAPLAPLLFRAVLVRRSVRLIAGRIAAQWPVPVRL